MSESGKTVSESIIASVREEVERGEIISYGEDKLPAGPAIKDSDAVIVVEGRNDVLNLLKYGIKNTIAVQGTNIPKTVQKLSKERTTTVFLDGDRGGDLILKEMLQVAEVDFVARAPPGTEVEELTYKQIVKALRYKTPTEQYLAMRGMNEDLKNYQERTDKSTDKEKHENTKEESQDSHEKKEPQEHHREHGHGKEENEEHREHSNQRRENRKETENHEVQNEEKHEKAPEEKKEEPPLNTERPFSLEDPESVRRKLNYLSNSKETEIFNEKGEAAGSFPLAEAPEKIEALEKVSCIITGGVISQRLVDIAHKKGASVIYGIKKGNITKKPEDMRIVPLEEA